MMIERIKLQRVVAEPVSKAAEKAVKTAWKSGRSNTSRKTAGLVRLKARLNREVKVLSRHTLSGL
jgi:hypothetical protein